MSELETLESGILAAIAAASTEAELEEVRVGALGKKGSVSEKLKTLGTLSPEERREAGPAINGLKQRVGEAIQARKERARRLRGEDRHAAKRGERREPPNHRTAERRPARHQLFRELYLNKSTQVKEDRRKVLP